jgi:acetyltransferase
MLYQQNNPEKPVVLKGINESVIHKSEFNAVKLNLRTKEEVSNAASEIAGEFKKHGFIVDDYIIQPFVKTKHELLIGGFRDPSFGPMIMFGSGGKYVEVFQDTVIKSAYLIPDDVDEMINKTKIGKILNGVRGEKPVDLVKLKSIILSAAQMLLDHDEISEFDINPLSVDEKNTFTAVDVRIRIK